MAKKGLSKILMKAKEDIGRSLGRTLGISSFPLDLTPEELEIWKAVFYIRNSYEKNPEKEILQFDSHEEARAYKIINEKPLGRYIVHNGDERIFKYDTTPYVKGD